ncbi:MAG: hypothetical protein ACR2OX_10320 [Methyloligellaceae bacterium]
MRGVKHPPGILALFVSFLAVGPLLLFVATALAFVFNGGNPGDAFVGTLGALFDVTRLILIYARFIWLVLIFWGVVSLASRFPMLASPVMAGFACALLTLGGTVGVAVVSANSGTPDDATMKNLIGPMPLLRTALLGFLPGFVCYWFAEKWSGRGAN